MWGRISGLFWFAFPWWLRMLNVSLGASQPFEFPQLRILCLALFPLFIRLFGSLETNFLSSLYILDIIPLLDVELVIIFNQSVGCYFVLLTVFFALQKLCNFIRFVLFRKSFPVPMCSRFFPVFFSISFSVFGLCGGPLSTWTWACTSRWELVNLHSYAY